MTITVHVQSGETIAQALNRASLIALSKEKHETIVLSPGVLVAGANVLQTRVKSGK